jgi:hypothetical protein
MIKLVVHIVTTVVLRGDWEVGEGSMQQSNKHG